MKPLVLVTVLVCGAVAPACGPGGEATPATDPPEAPMAREARPVEGPADARADESVRPAPSGSWPPAGDSLAGTPWTGRDWEIFGSLLRRADAGRFDTLPPGDAVAAMGRLLVGTPYVPRTLEPPGPERLVVNLRGLDCVTFVENVLALTRFHRVHGTTLLGDPGAARAAYEDELAALRYRDGRPDGYASRLHYFSDWLSTHADAGRLTLLTGRLGGIPDDEDVNFMSAHPDAYDQLADSGTLAAIRRVEDGLTARGPRMVIPQDRIADAAHGIRTGDVIAATSTVRGLDVAHTGLAVWADGALHLMHAPLVGDSVTISERSLATRIGATDSQDGIMVARPVPAWLNGRSPPIGAAAPASGVER